VKRKTGVYQTYRYQDESVKAFVPHPLPPQPPLALDSGLLDLLERAGVGLGKLDAITELLPDPMLFLHYYVRKEAIFSSQIEGTQSSMDEVLERENAAPGRPEPDGTTEVFNYVAAMQYGLARLSTLPLSLRLIREVHGKLMTGLARGGDKDPGEFRRSQNWIGGSRPGQALFVPPPPHELARTLGELEDFLHDKRQRTPPLIKAALIHVQFETIHPFLDGNGRLGRLLITFLLVHERLLSEPLLYLSLYLKTHRSQYYDLLQSVREIGNWEDWLSFFLSAVVDTSAQGIQTAKRLRQRFEADADAIRARGISVSSAINAHSVLQKHPFVSIPQLAQLSGLSAPTVKTVLGVMQSIGIVVESTGRLRDKRFRYEPYVAILREGTEPLPG
jgi:Fic family protein